MGRILRLRSCRHGPMPLALTSGAADDERQWITSSPVYEHFGCAGSKSSTVHVEFDQGSVPCRIKHAPYRNGFRWKAAVEKADQEQRTISKSTADLCEDFDRPLKILQAHAAERGIERASFERQQRVAIEVLNEPAVEPRIGGELALVHAVPNDLGVRTVSRQVADPAGHQVQNNTR